MLQVCWVQHFAEDLTALHVASQRGSLEVQIQSSRAYIGLLPRHASRILKKQLLKSHSILGRANWCTVHQEKLVSYSRLLFPISESFSGNGFPSKVYMRKQVCPHMPAQWSCLLFHSNLPLLDVDA